MANLDGLVMRIAQEDDIDIIYDMILELAEYEKLKNEVVATRELLYENMFIKNRIEDIIAEYDGEVVGHMLFFYNFSSFLGRSGIYLEDLYVKPEYRGKGFGKEMLKELVRVAQVRDCGRVEWVCLNENEPGMVFYNTIGARAMDEWTTYRFDEKAMEKFLEL